MNEIAQAFEAGAGISAESLRISLIGITAVGYVTYMAWLTKSAQSAWVDERINLKQLIVTVLRAVVLVTVFLSYLATAT